MVKELFSLDDAFLTVDMGSQGPSFEWTRPATGEVVTVDVNFNKEYPFLALADTGILPPSSLGEGFQPAWIYLDTLDIGLERMQKRIGTHGMGMVKLIGGDAQQHGIVLLNNKADGALRNLKQSESLKNQLAKALAYYNALTWQTGNTENERQEIEQGVGLERMIEIAGTGAPLRYSGTTLRWAGKNLPEAYKRTQRVHLIESLLGATLSGDNSFPVSWGGACGTALWNYKEKAWSPEILAAAGSGLQGGRKKLGRILPAIARLREMRDMSPYFQKYGLPEDAKVVPFVGDNPASRLLVPPVGGAPGNLISIATSITVNLGQKEARHDRTGNLLLMYDYKEGPFLLACKSCGTGEWDAVKKGYNVDHTEQDIILRGYIADIIKSGGNCAPREIFFSYSKKETFPKISVPFQQRVGIGGTHPYKPSKDADIRAVIESGLADIAVHAKDFLPEGQPVYVLGGATASEEILKMFASMLNRDIIVCEESTGGAAHGSNIALQMLYARGKGKDVSHEQFVEQVSDTNRIRPIQELAHYYHRPGGYLDAFRNAQTRIIQERMH